MVKSSLKRILMKTGFSVKPSFIIIGAQKSGTTSLYKILLKHDKILSPINKELYYFSVDHVYLNDTKYLNYHKLFPVSFCKNNYISFDATTDYLYHPACAERIFKYNKEIKLIALVRNPVERAYSAWNYFKNFPTKHPYYEKRTFSEAIQQELKEIEYTSIFSNPYSYIKRGLYEEQLRIYYKYFSKERLKLIEISELTEIKKITIELSQFLEINASQFCSIDNMSIRYNEGGYIAKIPISDYKILSDFYSKFNDRLFKLINKEYNWK